LDLHSLATRIYVAVTQIDSGRKGFALEGKEREGRINYEEGISEALSTFLETQAAADPQALLFAEYAFITQEFELTQKSDKDTINSLTKAIESFRDAILALKAVEKPEYKITDDVFPHDSKHRFRSYPNDSYHIACGSHQTRLKNILRAPGIDPIEKTLLKQRLANMSTAQTAYVEKQKKTLASDK